MPKRKYANDPNYIGALKQALPVLSASNRREVQLAVEGRPEDPMSYAIRDTSHLLIEETMIDEKGKEIVWRFSHPVKLVKYTLEHCTNLAGIYARALQQKPGTWRVVMGCDEHTPGSKITPHNKRNTCAFVLTFWSWATTFWKQTLLGLYQLSCGQACTNMWQGGGHPF